MVQVSSYDSAGRPSKEVLANEIRTLSRSLNTLHTSASSTSSPQALPQVPPELLEYVENGRNPDIYTREFVELVRQGNQLMRGKANAFASFRDVLAEDIASVLPELGDDVRKLCEATGAKVPTAAGGQTTSGGGGGGTMALDTPNTAAPTS